MGESMDMNCRDFVSELASKSPAPGGGGASAFVGAIGTALGAMVGSLTLGKKKYADVQDDIEILMAKADSLQGELLSLVAEDAEAFTPLSKAYGLPKDTPEQQAHKAEVMEVCLHDACDVPLRIMRACCEAIELIEGFAKHGSAIAISDAGCGAVICKSALQAASLNVFINTSSMKDTAHAKACEDDASEMLSVYCERADNVFAEVRGRI